MLLIFFYYFTFFILALLGIILTSFLLQYFNLIRHGYAVMHPTKRKIVRLIASSIEIMPGHTVFELGCGDGLILHALEARFPTGQYIGIENNFLPWFVSKIKFMALGSSITIRLQNIFKTDLSKAALIYCYLSDRSSRELETKIKSECRPGTQVLSLSFKMPNLRLTKKVEIDNQELYYYEA